MTTNWKLIEGENEGHVVNARKHIRLIVSNKRNFLLLSYENGKDFGACQDAQLELNGADEKCRRRTVMRWAVLSKHCKVSYAAALGTRRFGARRCLTNPRSAPCSEPQ